MRFRKNHYCSQSNSIYTTKVASLSRKNDKIYRLIWEGNMKNLYMVHTEFNDYIIAVKAESEDEACII